MHIPEGDVRDQPEGTRAQGDHDDVLRHSFVGVPVLRSLADDVWERGNVRMYIALVGSVALLVAASTQSSEALQKTVKPSEIKPL